MNIHQQLSPQELKKVFKILKKKLDGADGVVFQAMSIVAGELDIQFHLPQSEKEYPDKYKEISSRFDARTMRIKRGREVCVKLIEETINILDINPIIGISTEEILADIHFTINQPEATLCLSEYNIWELIFDLGEINIEVLFSQHYPQQIIPNYVLQYVSSAITSFKQTNYLATGALLSIALEGTLRDVLLNAGYDYHGNGRQFNTYKMTRAMIGKDEEKYTIQFEEEMPKTIEEFDELLDGNEEIPIRIRRTAKKKNRFDLTIINPTPSSLIDFWSTDQIEQERLDSIGGLGKALEVARENDLVTIEDLPLDIDITILAIRNALIHLSENSLRANVPHHNIPLAQFLEEKDLVLELIHYVIQFINQQYYKLSNI